MRTPGYTHTISIMGVTTITYVAGRYVRLTSFQRSLRNR